MIIGTLKGTICKKCNSSDHKTDMSPEIKESCSFQTLISPIAVMRTSETKSRRV